MSQFNSARHALAAVRRHLRVVPHADGTYEVPYRQWPDFGPEEWLSNMGYLTCSFRGPSAYVVRLTRTPRL